MNPLRKLIREVHHRSLWQVAGIYAAAGWGAVQVAETLTESAGLPEWFPAFAVGLLVLGLPFVLATAYVQEGPPGQDTAGRAEDAAAGSEGADDAAPGWAQDLFTWRNAILATLAGAALWGVAATVLLVRGGGPSMGIAGGRDTEVPEARRSIAVLPFTLVGSGDETEAFAYGIHDELLTRLSKMPRLRVTSRTSVLGYADNPKPIPEIGRELGVEVVLEGGIQRAGDRIRLNVQLIDTADDAHIWAEMYDRPFDAAGVFALQSELSQAVAQALLQSLTPEEVERLEGAEDVDPAALELARQAGRLDYLSSRENEAAIPLLRRAVELDPGFADGWASLAFRYHHRSTTHGLPTVWRDSAVVLADRALALDSLSTNAMNTLAVALSVTGGFHEARTVYQRFLRAAPSSAVAASNLALTVELRLGRLDEALYWAYQGVLLNPRDPYSWVAYAIAQSFLDDVEGARASHDRAVGLPSNRFWTTYFAYAMRPADDPVRDTLALELEAAQPGSTLALASRWVLLMQRGQLEEALAVARRLQAAHPGTGVFQMGTTETILGLSLAPLGRLVEAGPLFEMSLAELQGRAARGDDDPVPVWLSGLILAHLGQNDDALEHLERAFEGGARGPRYWDPPYNPESTPLAGHPRLLALKERMWTDLAQQQAAAQARVARLPPLPPPS